MKKKMVLSEFMKLLQTHANAGFNARVLNAFISTIKLVDMPEKQSTQSKGK